MDAREFRDAWLRLNPKTVHIPSQHEIFLMEAFAKYHHEKRAQVLVRALWDIKNWDNNMEDKYDDPGYRAQTALLKYNTNK